MGFNKWLGNHSDCVLLVAGIGASVMAGILFAHAGAKTAKDLDEAREKKKDNEDLEPKEKAKIAAKNFWLPCAVEGLSIFALVGSSHIKDVRATAAVASANLAAQALSDYRGEVKKQLGENTDRKITDEVAKSKVNKMVDDNDGNLPPAVNIKEPGDVYAIDSLTGQAFWTTPEKLHKAENMLVRDINEDFSATWEEWNNKLPIRPINEDVAEELEWIPDDHFSIQLTSTLVNERPVLYIQYNPCPHTSKRIADY